MGSVGWRGPEATKSFGCGGERGAGELVVLTVSEMAVC